MIELVEQELNESGTASTIEEETFPIGEEDQGGYIKYAINFWNQPCMLTILCFVIFVFMSNIYV